MRVLKLKELIYKFEEFFFDEAVSTFLDMAKMFLIVLVIGHWMACLFTATASGDDIVDNTNWIVLNNLQDGD